MKLTRQSVARKAPAWATRVGVGELEIGERIQTFATDVATRSLTVRLWLFRPWRIESARRPIDIGLLVSGAVLPAAVVYVQLLGGTPPLLLHQMASVVVWLWIASLTLRAAELACVLGVYRRESRLLGRAVAALGTRFGPVAPPSRRPVGWVVGQARAAKSSEAIRSTLLSGSAVVVTYMPGVITYLDVVRVRSAGHPAIQPAHDIRTLLLVEAGLFGLCAGLAAMVLGSGERRGVLRQAVDNAVRGQRSLTSARSWRSAARSQVGVFETRGGTSGRPGTSEKALCCGEHSGWRPRMSLRTNTGALSLPHVTVQPDCRGSTPPRVYLVPIGRPLDEGTSPLLEFVAFL